MTTDEENKKGEILPDGSFQPYFINGKKNPYFDNPWYNDPLWFKKNVG